MSEDRSIVVISDGEKDKKYRKIDGRGYQYKRDDTSVESRNFVGCIGRINSDDSLTILSIENKTAEENIEYQEEYFSLPEQIIDEIKK